MHARQKFLITLFVLIVLLAAGLWLIYFFYNQTQVITGQNTNAAKNNNFTATNKNTGALNTNAAVVANTNQAITPAEISEQDEKQYVLKTAQNFAERFGTYSSQNQSSNLLALKEYMTDDMKQWADELIAANKKKTNDIYESRVTKATTLALLEFASSQNHAVVLVGTIQQVTKGWPGEKSEEQANLEMEFLKMNGIWQVNRAYWHKN